MDFEEPLTTVTSFYQSDFNPAQLRLHLDILASNFPDTPPAEKHAISVMDIKEYVQMLSSAERERAHSTSINTTAIISCDAIYKCS